MRTLSMIGRAQGEFGFASEVTEVVSRGVERLNRFAKSVIAETERIDAFAWAGWCGLTGDVQAVRVEKSEVRRDLREVDYVAWLRFYSPLSSAGFQVSEIQGC